MRIVIVWPGFTGYLPSCWRMLSARAELRVYIVPSAYEQDFGAIGLDGIRWRRVGADSGDALGEIRSWRPDLTIVCGWRHPFCRAVGSADLGGAKILAFDMPWEWRLRKIAARWALRPYLRNFDAAFVPGESTRRYARFLGFRRIVTGSNPSGYERMASVADAAEVASRRGFVFVGRFVPDKGLGFLTDAYRAYRAQASDPEPLDLVGSGADLPTDLPEGVRAVGFVPPAEMPAFLARHKALVLPSRWEPWGVSAAEAMSAGLATVLSDRCGIASDVRPTEIVRYGDVGGLARALSAVAARSAEDLAAEGVRARAAVAPYADARWCDRVLGFVRNSEAGDV